jgi:hypothetical protein
MSDDILGLIDGAIEDYAVGPDAMRWTPDDGQPRTTGSPRTALDEAHVFAFDGADAGATLTRFALNGIDLTPYVSRVEFRGAEPHLTIIDETHVWIGETAHERIERFAVTGFGDDWRDPPRGLITATTVGDDGPTETGPLADIRRFAEQVLRDGRYYR